MLFVSTDCEPAMAGRKEKGLAILFEDKQKYGLHFMCLNHRENTKL